MSNLLDIENLWVKFNTRNGVFDAVRGVSFSLGQERLGIVGESGSGKIDNFAGYHRTCAGLERPHGRVGQASWQNARPTVL
jgi:peptide/nickel transport system ATP-binding protein